VSCNTSSREICSDHTVDQGNGYAKVEKVCHNESTKTCSYNRLVWDTIQSFTLQGNDLTPLYASPTLVSNQRLGKPSEKLTVYFDTAKGQQTYSLIKDAEFQKFTIGSSWTLTMDILGMVVSANP
jgi:hypothetical protein